MQTILLMIKGGRKVQAVDLSLKKNDFELGVRGEGQETSRNLKGGFGFMRAILPMWGLRAKNGPKPKIELNEIELSYTYCHHSICLKKRVFKKKNVVKIK